MQKSQFGIVQLGKVVLTEFDPSMAQKYFEWFQDPEIQKETATEALSLDQVADLAAVWAKPDVYTFIICDRNRFDPGFPEQSMIGDVNLFIEGAAAEINVMVAEKAYRRQGIASEVLDFIIGISRNSLGLKQIVAKISQQNIPSIKLFEKKGFVEVERNEDFQEIHFKLEFNI